MPVPVSSDGSPPSQDHSEGHSRGSYRGPPPPGHGYGSPYHPAYGYPGPPHYGGPPPHHGYPHHPGHGGPPPPGYHPHHPGNYSPSGYPSGGRPIYPFGGYDGSGPPGGLPYPMQQNRDGRSKTPTFQRSGGRSSAGSMGGRSASSSPVPRASPANRRETTNKASPEQQTQSQQQPPPQQQPARGETPSSIASRSSPTKLADEVETERLRQAALTEISASEVAPIKTAFHFFVIDMREEIMRAAQEEVQKSAPHDQKLDLYLVNSNMNCRLMKAWEDLSSEKRQDYQTKEEADRRRFMAEEEIASRHCATLTARSKSPKTPERRGSRNDTSNRSSPVNPSPTASFFNNRTGDPSPSPLSQLTVGASSSMDHDEKKMDDSAGHLQPSRSRPVVNQESVEEKKEDIADSSKDAVSKVKGHKEEEEEKKADDEDQQPDTNKRPSPLKTDEKGESPPKRNRLDEAGADDNVEAGTEIAIASS